MPARPAMAMRWISALVEPPIAMRVTIALSNDLAVRMSRGLRSSHTISTARLPQSVAIFAWFESGAGMDEAPGSARPSASVIDIIVAAVPIVMQVAGERAV